jgi:hypothetical protein
VVQKRRLLPGYKDIQWPFAGGAVDPLARHRETPGASAAAHFPQAGEDAVGEEALPGVVDISFYPWLVLWVADTRRVDDAAVVAEKLAISAVYPRVVEVRAEDAGAQIVGHDAARCSAEEGESLDMGLQPGLAVLTQDGIEELVPAVREGHEEGVEPALSLCFRVKPAACVEKIDLGFFTWRRIVQAHCRPWRRPDLLGPVQGCIAIERRPACRKALLVPQALVEDAQPHSANPLSEIRVEGNELLGRRTHRPRGRDLLHDRPG